MSDGEQKTLRLGQGARLYKYSKALFVYAAVCFVSAWWLGSGEVIYYTSIKSTGGVAGPIKIPADATVIDVELEHHVPNNSWSWVGASLLDSNQNYLMGFGDEVWAETGRDAEGRWSESKTSFSIALTIPKRGSYYIDLDAESKNPSNQKIRLVVRTQRGSTIALKWLGTLGLLAAIAAFLFAPIVAAAEGTDLKPSWLDDH